MVRIHDDPCVLVDLSKTDEVTIIWNNYPILFRAGREMCLVSYAARIVNIYSMNIISVG